MMRIVTIGPARLVGVATAATLASTGLWFALSGDSDPTPERADVATAPSVTLSPGLPTATRPSLTPASFACCRRPTHERCGRTDRRSSTESATVGATSAPGNPVQPTPTPTPTPTSSSAPVLPRFSDLAVLKLAAGARLPSGLTFQECVDLPPAPEKWPFAVHLYYMGGGRWMVETHISEVQVIFDEATETFTPGNFEPLSPACR